VNVATIIRSFTEKKLVVVSAMGKTTNALEAVVKAVYDGDTAKARELAQVLLNHHYNAADALDPSGCIKAALQPAADELLKLVTEPNSMPFDQLYDQVVPVGELLSSCILAKYLKLAHAKTELLDARTIVKTSSEYRFATVNVQATSDLARKAIDREADIFIVQGFIGQDEDGFTTTLGREGSDYTAALMAYSVDATELTIWKDVAGIFSADPKKFSQAELLPTLNYRLAAEMTFYGAQVIHPRTLQPLEGKGIELKVKSFLHPEGEGSVISNATTEVKAPIIIQKEDLTLLTFYSTGIVFISDGAIAQILGEAKRIQARVYLMQHSALSFSIAIGSDFNKADKLQRELSSSFNIMVIHNLTLLTLRNSPDALEEELLMGNEVLLSQFSRRTHQYLLRRQGG
jgi:aspartate kinase